MEHSTFKTAIADVRNLRRAAGGIHARAILKQQSKQQYERKVMTNTYLAAAHMAVKYNKRRELGYRSMLFSVGDKVTISQEKKS